MTISNLSPVLSVSTTMNWALNVDFFGNLELSAVIQFGYKNEKAFPIMLHSMKRQFPIETMIAIR